MSESEAAARHADSPRRRARAAAEWPGEASAAGDASQSPYAAYAPGGEAAYQPGHQAGYDVGYESSATSGYASNGYGGSDYPAVDPARDDDPGGYSSAAYGEQSYGRYPEPTSSGQQYAEQSYAGQSYADQIYADQSYAGQTYADQSYAGQTYSDQSYADQSYGQAAYGEQSYEQSSAGQSYDRHAYAGQPYDQQPYAGQDPYPNQQPYAGADYTGEHAGGYAGQPYPATGYPSGAGGASESMGSALYGQHPVEQSPYAVTTVNDPRTPYPDVADPVSTQVQPAPAPSVPVPAAPQSPMNGSPIAPGYESASGYQAPVGRGAEQPGGYAASSDLTTSFATAAPGSVGYRAPAYREQGAPEDPFAPGGHGATVDGRPDTGVILRPGRGTPDDQAWAGASAPPRRRGSDGDLGGGRPRSSSAGGVFGALSARLGAGRRDGERSRRPDPEPATPRQAAVSALTEIVVVLVMALGLSLIIKTFLVQAFFIPSVSMRDTLQVGDRVLVSKLTPGPFTLHRGDVVVFKDPGGWLGQQQARVQTPVRHSLTVALTFVGLLPQDSGEHLIKRVIGLPGDTVSCDGKGKVLVNGVPIDESYVRQGNLPSVKAFTVKVQPGHLWVMGDNRGESYDSRFHPEIYDGQVPMKNVVGKAFVIVWPFSDAGGVDNPPSVFARVPDAPPAATK